MLRTLILLIDVDSKIPNLALMKISTYHKAKGDSIVLVRGSQVDLSDKPDKVYISVIYKKNKPLADSINAQYPDIDIDIGGSGCDLHKELPPEIEVIKPDYNLYPENDYSIGFSSRGCIRNCHFCVVPIKEGKFRRVQHPSQWYNPAYKKIVFLDNNILADKQYFMEITAWCVEKKLKVQFNQGLDIRKMDEGIARRIFEMPKHGMINFAWDHIEDEAIIKEKIELLKSVGFTKSQLRMHVQFYVYVDSDAEYQSGVYRCRELKKLGVNTYVMYNIDNKQTPRIKSLKRWSKCKEYFWLFDIADYKGNLQAAKTIRLKSVKAGVANT